MRILKPLDFFSLLDHDSEKIVNNWVNRNLRSCRTVLRKCSAAPRPTVQLMCASPRPMRGRETMMNGENPASSYRFMKL